MASSRSAQLREPSDGRFGVAIPVTLRILCSRGCIACITMELADGSHVTTQVQPPSCRPFTDHRFDFSFVDREALQTRLCSVLWSTAFKPATILDDGAVIGHIDGSILDSRGISLGSCKPNWLRSKWTVVGRQATLRTTRLRRDRGGSPGVSYVSRCESEGWTGGLIDARLLVGLVAEMWGGRLDASDFTCTG